MAISKIQDRSNATTKPSGGDKEAIELWAKILPFIVLATLFLYFLCVIIYYRRKLQNYDDIGNGTSYTARGPLESQSQRRLSPGGNIQPKRITFTPRPVLDTKDSEFSFRPVQEKESKNL
ncbi:hypothetical protein ElyMa_000087900 [Elysia marginata]|uniref:Resistance to inhibitors of cholinesterase protein 3 N-terminal domain-containing protein n=1 Tax=Elysia marginata TaxID=1093978 RepID=A0AAV4EIF3_9GAST|nr:hypothetical protein ElyMa_000087900 [Elysia marginata]